MLSVLSSEVLFQTLLTRLPVFEGRTARLLLETNRRDILLQLVAKTVSFDAIGIFLFDNAPPPPKCSRGCLMLARKQPVIRDTILGALFRKRWNKVGEKDWGRNLVEVRESKNPGEKSSLCECVGVGESVCSDVMFKR